MNNPLSSRPIVEYRFECADQSSSWQVLHFYCDQRVNHCDQGRLLLIGDPEESSANELIGQRVSIHLALGPSLRSFGGIVHEVQNLSQVHGHPVIAVEFAPALALAKQKSSARVFQERSSLEIAQSVLGPLLAAYGSKLELGQVDRGQDQLDFRVQYDESDYAFATRILAQAGINYALRYDHERDAESMVLFDRNVACPMARNLDASPTFAYHSGDTGLEIETIQSFSLTQRLRSSVIQGTRWDWKVPGSQTSKAPGARPIAELAHEDPKQYREDHAGLEQRVQDQALRRSAQAQNASGTSQALGLGIGCVFELDEHPVEGLDGPYLVTRLVHEGTCLDLGLTYEDLQAWVKPGPRYENRFFCVPQSAALLPDLALCPPRIVGPMTALVCGPKKGQVHVDDQGRIQLRFHWDRSTPKHQPGSCWVRVAQAWTGDGFGMNFIPRVGSEVLVEFLQGDPNQPIVTGSVPNRATPSPFKLPVNKHQSGVVTRSSDGADGYNELRFDDQCGQEQVYLRAQDTLSLDVLGPKLQQVGGDHVQIHEANDSLQIKGAQSIEVDGPSLAQFKDSLIQDVGANGWHMEVQGQTRLASQGSHQVEAKAGFEVESAKGGAKVALAKKLRLKASAVQIKCGSSTLEIDESGALSLKAPDQPISIEGAKIRLNS